MKVRYKYIESKIEELQTVHPWLLNSPVDIKKLIASQEIRLTFEKMNHSGVSISKGNDREIKINLEDSDVRQRFTMAHELGHIALHNFDPVTLLEISTRDSGILYYRNDSSSKGKYWHEVEANHFAANILMPEILIIKEFEAINRKKNVEEEDIEFLAKKFKVSIVAMSIRLGTLGFNL